MGGTVRPSEEEHFPFQKRKKKKKTRKGETLRIKNAVERIVTIKTCRKISRLGDEAIPKETLPLSKQKPPWGKL